MSRLKPTIAFVVALVAVGAVWSMRSKWTATRSSPGVSIAIEVDGTAREPVDSVRLSKRSPERRYEGWRLWRLAPLIGVDLAGAVVILDHADGKLGGFSLPPAATGVESWFAADAKGRAAIIVASSSAEPLPALDVVDGFASLTKIRVTTRAGRSISAAKARSNGTEVANLSISFADGSSTQWTMADLQRVPARQRIPTERGDVPGWSLRDIAAALVDRTARVGSIANAQGEASTISAPDWSDSKRTPILRVNQRGSWKFDWIDSATKSSLAEGSLRDVSTIRFVAR